jgi:hypothetical protein
MHSARFARPVVWRNLRPRGPFQGAIQTPNPIIASDTAITRRSIVSHWGMRFAGCWVMACASAARITVPEERKL